MNPENALVQPITIGFPEDLLCPPAVTVGTATAAAITIAATTPKMTNRFIRPLLLSARTTLGNPPQAWRRRSECDMALGAAQSLYFIFYYQARVNRRRRLACGSGYRYAAPPNPSQPVSDSHSEASARKSVRTPT